MSFVFNFGEPKLKTAFKNFILLLSVNIVNRIRQLYDPLPSNSTSLHFQQNVFAAPNLVRHRRRWGPIRKKIFKRDIKVLTNTVS